MVTLKKVQVMTTIKPDFASNECNKTVKQLEFGFLSLIRQTRQLLMLY